MLARTLTRLLEQVWPALRVAGVAEDGLRATELALAEAPDVVFLDIRMPGRNGIEVAEVVTDDWPDDRAALMQRVQSIAAPPVEPGERIKVIRAGVGNTVGMIPVADVVCFEATEKYVNVVTPAGEALVRMSLRELMARIASTDFIQLHRSVMVASNAIPSATRDENGHDSLSMRGLQRPLKVSRAFGNIFRPMQPTGTRTVVPDDPEGRGHHATPRHEAMPTNGRRWACGGTTRRPGGPTCARNGPCRRGRTDLPLGPALRRAAHARHLPTGRDAAHGDAVEPDAQPRLPGQARRRAGVSGRPAPGQTGRPPASPAVARTGTTHAA